MPLFVALDVLASSVLNRFIRSRRDSEFIYYPDAVEVAALPSKAIHAILFNAAVPKHPQMRVWLARLLRWTFNVTLATTLSLNAVESFIPAPANILL